MQRAFKLIAGAVLLAMATFLGAAPASAQLRYDNPHAQGAVVDWCASWASNCGWGGAHQYCQRRGHPRALSWNVYRPGRTWVAGSNQYCNGPNCQGFSQVTCATSHVGPGPGPGPYPGPGPGFSRRFHNPQVNGATVDWCSSWATDCGWGGAHQLCRQYGFISATSWNVYRPGRTWVIGTGQYCNGPNCQGFSQVSCRR